MPLALRAFLGLLLALVPAGLVQVELEQRARQERTEQEAEVARYFVHLLARHVAATIEGARQTLVAIGTQPGLGDAVPADAACHRTMRRLVAASPRYLTADYYGPDGSAHCGSHAVPGGAGIAEQGFFRRILAGAAFEVGEYSTASDTGRPALHFALARRDEAGALAGVLVLALAIEWLNEDLARFDLPPGSAATIADRLGTILARVPGSQRYAGTALPDWVSDLVHRPEGGIIDTTSLDGVRRVAAYLPLGAGPEGLFIAFGVDPRAAVERAIAADRVASLLIVGSLLLAFIIGLAFFQANVDRPMRCLLGAALLWREQDWGARIGAVRGATEFRRLATAFDAMAEAVESREAARRAAATRLEAVVEVAPQLVLTADAQGRVDWSNPHWTRVTGRDRARTNGDAWRAAIHPDDRPGFESAWHDAVAAAQRGERPQLQREVRVVTAGGTPCWYALRGAPQIDEVGWPRGWMIVGLDIDALHAAQTEAATLAADLRATYETAPVGLCLLDRELRFVAINEALAQFNGAPADAHIGRTLEEMAPHLPPEVPAAMRSVLETGKPLNDLEVRREVAGVPRVWLCNYRPIFAADGSVRGVSRAVIDITSRKRVEESERLLAREVDHRAQNALAVARGLVRLSAADAGDDVAALVATLDGRIAALSRVHGVLAREKWVAAELHALVAQELGVHTKRIAVDGPAVRLTAQAAQPFTLVLHELATNAVKYGALSEPGGRILLGWEAAGEALRVTWRETGGPRIAAPPSRSGFGSLLIDANVGAPLDGKIERHWDAEGFRCVITLGPAALVGRPGPAAGPLHGRRVLMAHDDPARALGLIEMLQAAGCEVIGPVTAWPEAMAAVEAVQRVDAAVVTPALAGEALESVLAFLGRRAGITLWLGSADLLSAQQAAGVVALDGDRPAALRLALVHAWSG